MSLVVCGLSHRACPLDVRERMTFAPDALPGALLDVRRRLDGAGTVILNTCNRVEFYVHHVAPPQEIASEIRRFLSASRAVGESVFAPHLYEREGREAVAHLFRVATSLDSLVVGEGQILGQVHDAYLMAQERNATDKVINALFQRAFSLAKEVRTRTPICAGKVSIGSVAVDLAVNIFMRLTDKTVMVIGSGKMGALALRSLMSRGARNVIVVNRSLDKARHLAEPFGGEAAPLEELPQHLHRADIAISSTAAPDHILGPDDFRKALAQRGRKPMFVIDIAVPRNIDPAVNDLDDVYLYDLDNLQEVADANLQSRRNAIAQANVFVDRAVDQFMVWMGGLAAEPTIVSMAQELHAIRERELQKTLSCLPELSEAQRAEVEYLTKRLVNAILQRPVTQLKQEVAHPHQDPHTVLHLVKRLFGLKDTP
ncbi:MAG TPA: glutamyl-tRNA reductase [Candidatus Hydrogenedentes bacterium]|nr:glutamyl-tRNA reductase [Candidatus Hydrogenedentota bacterium]HOS01978.1 glutamyl-tRNA reductase [Candidatus Hydrogenedentota bacterium]